MDLLADPDVGLLFVEIYAPRPHDQGALLFAITVVTDVKIQDQHVFDQGREPLGNQGGTRSQDPPCAELDALGFFSDCQHTGVMGSQDLGKGTLAPIVNRASTPEADS